MSNSFSILIHNQTPKNLISIVDILKDKITNKNKIELIIINEQRYLNKENNNLLEIVDNQCQRENMILKRINLQDNELVCLRLSEFITGEIIVFTSSSYIPDDHWLDNIKQAFSNSSINILMGNIIEPESELQQNSINDSSINKPLHYLQIWQKQMGNLAIRKEFLEKINYFDFLNSNYCNDSIYCRILRELENEIQYLPNAIVRTNIKQV